MTAKRCATCGQHKPLTAFNQRASSPDGRQPRCRDCCRRWYEQNATQHKARVRERNRRVVEENRRLLMAFLEQHPCVDCGEADLRVLELDHEPGTEKAADVADLVNDALAWSVVQAEIQKCQVRCANCHRIATGVRGAHYRQRFEEHRLASTAQAARDRLRRVLP